jgi:microsomal epoxide hydrolase
MSLPFSTPPSKVSLVPFKAGVPEAKINLLRAFLDLAKFAPPTYENSQTDRRYGVDTDWLVTMSKLWRQSYDW